MTPSVAILLAVFLPLAAALPVAWVGRRLGRRTAWVAIALPLVSFLSLLSLALQAGGPVPEVRWAWIPTLGLELAFLPDGLGLVFGLIVSGMGILIFFYAGHYLDDHYEHHGRFYAYLTLFMAAMLGTVLSDNLLLLFVFWELTGIASFLLIGFLHGEEGSRRGARMALLVTAGTGLAALAGIVLLREIGGTLSLRALLSTPGIVEHPLAGVSMVLLLLGAFGKSAQFPFHIWLPNAMAAPTPVSAYLHSATMVKLGVFLTARLFPIFQAHPWWPPVVATIAFTTLLLGAVLALLAYELKAILAFSTVSQLGFLIGYYGLGSAGGVENDYLHILNHVFYKGALFMLAGIVIHATHLKDIRDLGGLWRRMPVVGILMAVACAAMAGLPGTTGFLSKELMLKEIFDSPLAHGGLGWWAIISVVLTSLIKVAFSFRLFVGIFLGEEGPRVKEHFHAPGWPILVPPLLLAGAALVFGVAPGLLSAGLQAFVVPGLHVETLPELHVWHGINREFLTSLAVVAGGTFVVVLGTRARWRWARTPRWLRWDLLFERGVDGLGNLAKGITKGVGSDTPQTWLRIVMTFAVLLVGGYLAVRLPASPLTELLGERLSRQHWDGLRVATALLMALSAVGVIVLRTWPGQLISLSVFGFLNTLYFVLYHAPDLALTQILVDTVTLILVVVLLARFPRSAQEGEESDRRWSWKQAGVTVVAVGFGATMTLLGLLMTARPHPEPIGPWFARATVPLAEGMNAVNTILVDFRGVDTMGEITVLVIAMLGCLGLLFRRRRSPEERAAGAMGPPGLGTQLEPEEKEF